MHLSEFQQRVESVFIPSAAISGDNVGMHVDSRRALVSNVLVCLEVTDAVISEASRLACDAIIAFHPLIYTPLMRVNQQERVGRLVSSLIASDIALYCVHTAYDVHPQGTNRKLADKLDLASVCSIEPSASNPDFGMGIIATPEIPLSMTQLVSRVQESCNCTSVRWLDAPSANIRSVAIVAGSGSSFIDAAVIAGADVIITADVKYHTFLAAEGHIGIIDPGHFEMEQFVPDGIIETLIPVMGQGVTLRRSAVAINPVSYFSIHPEPSIT